MVRLDDLLPWNWKAAAAFALPNVSELDAYGIRDPQPAHERLKGASLGDTLTCGVLWPNLGETSPPMRG